MGELKEHNSLDQPELFINRKLSWIRFNARVLEEALDPTHPPLERVKFLAICGSNLDEFFMTRVSALLKMIKKDPLEISPDAMTPLKQVEATRREIIPLIARHSECWKNGLLQTLAEKGIYIQKYVDLNKSDRTALRDYFTRAILPKLKTRIQDFARITVSNLSINLLLAPRNAEEEQRWTSVSAKSRRC